jgi:hypothetical protein
MVIEEIRDPLWERFFECAKAPFKREDVVEVVDLKSSPFSNDLMSFCGIFKLKNGTFGMIKAEYSGSWDEVSLAICHTGNTLEEFIPRKEFAH